MVSTDSLRKAAHIVVRAVRIVRLGSDRLSERTKLACDDTDGRPAEVPSEIRRRIMVGAADLINA